MVHPVGAKHASCQEEILPNQNVRVKNRVSGSAWSKFTGSSDHNGTVSNDLQDWHPICHPIRGGDENALLRVSIPGDCVRRRHLWIRRYRRDVCVHREDSVFLIPGDVSRQSGDASRPASLSERKNAAVRLAHRGGFTHGNCSAVTRGARSGPVAAPNWLAPERRCRPATGSAL